MEKFAIDLDRVLDEFELNEDLASTDDPPSVQLVPVDVPFDPPPFKSTPSDDDDYGVTSTINLEEADFCADDRILLPVLDSSFPPCTPSKEVDVESSSSSRIEAESLLSENSDVIRGSESGTCIKVLHCDDEVINKDYLVTFGRKVESNRTNERREEGLDENGRKVDSVVTATVSSDDLDRDATSSSVPLLFDLVGEFEKESRSNGLGSSERVACVTPDDDSGDSAVDMAPVVGFGTFVNITEDDLDLYLREEENEMECQATVVATEVQAEPLVEHPVQRNEEICARSREETGKCIEENMEIEAVEPILKTEVTVLEEEGTDGCTCIDDDDGIRADEALTSDAICSHSLLKLTPELDETVISSFRDEHVNSAASEPNMNVYREECGGSVDRECTLVDEAEADEGYEADETSPSDHFSSFCEQFSSDEHLRVERPTSLYLPEKIDYEQPPPSTEFGITPIEEDQHFATLVSTAGSPEAVSMTPPSSPVHVEDESLASTSLTEDERMLGKVAPVWVPDADAPVCMQCDAKFTLVKRRHHCRACGKVLCAGCCGTKARLCYMDNKEARVCVSCVDIMKKVETLETRIEGAQGQSLAPNSMPHWIPNPNNPSEYCSVIPPLQQAQPNAPPPTVMVPVGVLKRGSGKTKGEPKQVMFSDGIRPGGDLTELDGPEVPMPNRRHARVVKKVEHKNTGQASPSSALTPQPQGVQVAQSQDFSLSDTLDMDKILPLLLDDCAKPVGFCVAKNLRVLVKIVNLDCCFHRMCWSFTTRGMSAVGQDEIVVLLEMLPEERVIPLDVVRHLSDVYEDAAKGVVVSGMGHSIFTKSFLGSREHGGFLYIRPTFQCLNKLVLPPAPYLFAILLQKWETPWAKLFPLRLFLRLGAEFRYYPCPLVGIRFRKPVYCEIGHTIMNLLADFHNYQYTLPLIPGLVVHMEDKQTFISFPRNRYDEAIKALNSSIDHVLALAATFSVEADSHLVCIQSDDGNYHTQAINIRDKPRQVTGASFVVFNGALKTSSGLTAKLSIVEDGLMVQISSDNMQSLRQSLRDMKDYVIACGAIGAELPDEVVHLRWVDDDRTINIGVESPIDGMSMDGISSIRIRCGTDYVGDGLVIRWTEVYIVKSEEGHRSDPVDLGKVSDSVARACCLALTPHLLELFSSGLVRIGLRVTLDSEDVGYEIGAGGRKLSHRFVNDLDSELVPAIHGAASPSQEGPIVLELIFHILEQ